MFHTFFMVISPKMKVKNFFVSVVHTLVITPQNQRELICDKTKSNFSNEKINGFNVSFYNKITYKYYVFYFTNIYSKIYTPFVSIDCSWITCIINIYSLQVFFTPALADGFSQECEWMQVSSSLQNSSQYSGRYQPCCSLDGLHSSSYFKVFEYWYQSFGGCTKSTNYNSYNRHLHDPLFFFSIPLKGWRTYTSFRFISMLFSCPAGQQSSQFGKFPFFFFFFFFTYYKVWSSGRDLLIRVNLKIPAEFVRLILQDRFFFSLLKR